MGLDTLRSVLQSHSHFRLFDFSPSFFKFGDQRGVDTVVIDDQEAELQNV